MPRMKLSVLVITYNHEKFIARALDGIFSQQVGFDYEVVIGEDCSTDNTREILNEYKEKYPEKIKLHLREKNLGMNRNFIETFKDCSGEYIALLEGDDFWVVSNKLQSQVEFLDQKLDFAMCFHDVVQFNHSTGHCSPWALRSRQSRYLLEDVLQGNFIPTAAVVFRRRYIDYFPEFSTKLGMLDWLVNILVSSRGDIGFIDQIMGVYSLHDGGVWSSKSQLNILRSSVAAAQEMLVLLQPKHKEILQHTINMWGQVIVRMTQGKVTHV